MKISFSQAGPRGQSTHGSAVIVILAFLAIMVLLVASNTKTVNWLRAEVRLTDQRETARLAGSVKGQTNSVSATTLPTTIP